MSRISKLENIYQKQLKEKDIQDISGFIQSILNADITKGKYARFLIDAFLNDKFLKEDLVGSLDSTIGQTISLFDKHKSKLPVEQRSVYALNPETGKVLYQSPGDLWNSVKQYQGQLSGKELKKEEQEKIYRETEFVYKDEETGFQIVSPLTEDSAKWWGKGTRWCTSADKNNMFWNYAQKSPLFILLMPNGNKLQVWKKNNNIQFMDEADNDVTLEYIEQNWNILEPICSWLNDIRFTNHNFVMDFFNKNNKLLQNYKNYFLVDDKYRTMELYDAFLKGDKKSMLIFPIENEEKILNMIINNEIKFSYNLPENIINLKNCLLLLNSRKQDIRNGVFHSDIIELLKHISMFHKQSIDNLMTKYDFQDLFKLHKEILVLYQEYFSEDDFKTYINSCDQHYSYILHKNRLNDKFKTQELMDYVFRLNKKNIQMIPFNFITKNIAQDIIDNDMSLLRHLPEKYLTEDNICKGLKYDNYILKFISKDLQTLKIALEAYNYSDSYFYVRDDLKQYIDDNNLLDTKKTYDTLEDIIDNFNPKKIIQHTQQYGINLLEQIPENKWNIELLKYLILEIFYDNTYCSKIIENKTIYDILERKKQEIIPLFNILIQGEEVSKLEIKIKNMPKSSFLYIVFDNAIIDKKENHINKTKNVINSLKTHLITPTENNLTC